MNSNEPKIKLNKFTYCPIKPVPFVVNICENICKSFEVNKQCSTESRTNSVLMGVSLHLLCLMERSCYISQIWLINSHQK